MDSKVIEMEEDWHRIAHVIYMNSADIDPYVCASNSVVLSYNMKPMAALAAEPRLRVLKRTRCRWIRLDRGSMSGY